MSACNYYLPALFKSRQCCAMKVLADFDIVCIEQKELQEIVLTNRQIVAAVQARQQVAMSLPVVEESERRTA